MNDTLNEYLENLGHYLDWDYAAPSWANWFAVDRNGWAHWFMLKPIPSQYSEEWCSREEDWLGGEYACILPQSDMLSEYWTYSIVDLDEKRKTDANKPQPRPGAHIWKAWADGKTVQVKIYRHDQLSLDEPEFMWLDDDPRNWGPLGPDDEPENWRVRPHKRQFKCRIAVVKMPVPMEGRKKYMTQTAYDRDQERMIESDPDFYAWATDWIEVAVPYD